MNNSAEIPIIKKEISAAAAEIIVIPANSRGYIGDKQRAVNAEMKRYCLKKARLFEHIPSFLFGAEIGDFFTSPPFGFNCTEVVHAVVSRFSHGKCGRKTAAVLANSIFGYCRHNGYNTVAIALRCRDSRNFNELYNLISKTALLFPELSVEIYKGG